MSIITMKVTFNGLYDMSVGWKDGVVANKWYDFWESSSGSGIFWTHFMKDDGFQKIHYLVTPGGAVYLHPMGFDVLYRKIGGCYKTDKQGNRVEVFVEIEELKELCELCCDTCGGSVSFSEPKVSEI